MAFPNTITTNSNYREGSGTLEIGGVFFCVLLDSVAEALQLFTSTDEVTWTTLGSPQSIPSAGFDGQVSSACVIGSKIVVFFPTEYGDGTTHAWFMTVDHVTGIWSANVDSDVGDLGQFRNLSAGVSRSDGTIVWIYQYNPSGMFSGVRAVMSIYDTIGGSTSSPVVLGNASGTDTNNWTPISAGVVAGATDTHLFFVSLPASGPAPGFLYQQQLSASNILNTQTLIDSDLNAVTDYEHAEIFNAASDGTTIVLQWQPERFSSNKIFSFSGTDAVPIVFAKQTVIASDTFLFTVIARTTDSKTALIVNDANSNDMTYFLDSGGGFGAQSAAFGNLSLNSTSSNTLTAVGLSNAVGLFMHGSFFSWVLVFGIVPPAGLTTLLLDQQQLQSVALPDPAIVCSSAERLQQVKDEPCLLSYPIMVGKFR